MLSSLSKDFMNLVRSTTNAIFWLSGVIYDIERIKNPTIRFLYNFNPITVIARGYRNIFIYKQWFFEDRTALMGFSVTLLALLFLALWSFKSLRKDIPDVL